MSVHPIEFRYFYDDMRNLFTEEAKLQNWLNVEAALARGHAKLGHIPEAAAREITAKANTSLVKLDRVKKIESEINHDLMAMVKGLTEVCSDSAGKYVHFGATSYDIEDTALALQLTGALKIIDKDLKTLRGTLVDLAEKHKNLVCIGRTHGQQAVPTTYGLKFAIYACELERHLDRLAVAHERLSVGKMSGAVGSQASFGKDAGLLQSRIMAELGLKAAEVSNQVIQRDRHGEAICLLALIASTADKIAKEIRNLQRTEIGEVGESFSRKQVGSSTMPHKRNPFKSERVCSLARVVRAQAGAALENIALEHERDLTNSAAERVIFPESFILTDYLLRQLNEIIIDLVLNEENIKRNLNFTGGLVMFESLMIGLVEKGMGRQEAHEILRVAAGEVWVEKKNLMEVLSANKQIRRFMGEDELENYLNPRNYIGTAVEQVEAVVKNLRSSNAGL
ncbi:MAG: adenylosuccinate lyase [Lentisphaerae bacterium]|nr:adenylosuccinate lyase [Lentisphaerota bacterium]